MSSPDAFHAHLEVCAQCRDHPFALCSVGVALIHEAVLRIGDEQLLPRAASPEDRPVRAK